MVAAMHKNQEKGFLTWEFTQFSEGIDNFILVKIMVPMYVFVLPEMVCFLEVLFILICLIWSYLFEIELTLFWL